jgi:type VI protein secretion system component Hcp
MRAAFCLCILLLAARARGAFDVFLRVTPLTGPAIQGDTPDPLYSGWIQATSFQAGTDTPVQIAPNFTVGRTIFRRFSLTKSVDSATAPLFGKLMASGPLLTVKMVIALRSPMRVELWDIQATNCLVASQSLRVALGEDLEEQITFAMTGLEWSYIQVNSAGDPIGEWFSNWSLLTGTGSAGTRAPDYLGGVDSDGDGLPDGWELFYGLNPHVADSDLDSDGDGLTNLQEYIAHTDPRSPQSVLRVTAFQQAVGQDYQLTWMSVTGLTYRVQGAPSPAGPWSLLQTVPSSGSTTSISVSGAASRMFFRVVTP